MPLKDGNDAMTGMVSILRDVTGRFAELRELRKALAAAKAAAPV